MTTKRELEHFLSIQSSAEKMVNEDTDRVAMLEDMRDMFMMEWSGQPTAQWIRKVVSPDAFDTIMGLVRLMMASEPEINVPIPGQTETIVKNEDMERVLRSLLRKANKTREVSALDDAVLSASLFGEVVFRVGNTQDIIARAEKSGNLVLATQAKKLPFTIDTVNPICTFAETDLLGLHKITIYDHTTAGKVRDYWGKLFDKQFAYDDDDEIELYDYWDRTWRAVWVKGEQDPIICSEHKLPFIPIVRKIVQGTKLWTRDEATTIWPILYAFYKSGMWDAQNISYTMIYSLAYAMGSVPFLGLYKKSQNQADPEIDWTSPGINVRLLEGQEIKRVVDGVIPEDMLRTLNLVEQKTPEMLMPKVVFGQSPGTNMSFSAINLLSQGGRLPIIPIQEGVATAVADVLETILMWVKDDNTERAFWNEGMRSVLNPAEIDIDELHVDVKITPDIPMDRMQIGTLVNQLVAQGVISKKRAREWLHVMDDTGETEQILLEQYTEAQAQRYAQQIGEASDIEMLAGEQAANAPEPREGPPQASTEGPLFDLSQGGIPQVQMGNMPNIQPLVPGGQGGDLMFSNPDQEEVV